MVWLGRDKQWVSMDKMRLHDTFLVIRYAARNKIVDKPGWEWEKYYLESDNLLGNMV